MRDRQQNAVGSDSVSGGGRDHYATESEIGDGNLPELYEDPDDADDD
jgi:hypothetical protein